MAEIACQLSAIGNEPGCTGCEEKFIRGETMNAVEYDDGSPAGWFCNECIEKWKTGELFKDKDK